MWFMTAAYRITTITVMIMSVSPTSPRSRNPRQAILGQLPKITREDGTPIRVLLVDDEPVELTRKEFDIVAVLARYPGVAVPRRVIHVREHGRADHEPGRSADAGDRDGEGADWKTNPHAFAVEKKRVTRGDTLQLVLVGAAGLVLAGELGVS